MNWQNKIYQHLEEAERAGKGHQFAPGDEYQGMKKGLEAEQGVFSPKERAEAFATPPNKRTPLQRRIVQGSEAETENITQMLSGKKRRR